MVKVAEVCAGNPTGKTASIGYVPGGAACAEGTIMVAEKVPVGDVVTY